MALGFAQGFKAAIGQVDVTPFEPLGVIRYTDNFVYKYVKFTGTTAVAVGDPVGYVLSDTSLQTVDPASTTIAAGVSPAVVASGTVQYGWIQIGGVVTCNGVTATAGNEVKLSGTKTVAAKAAVTDPTFGIAVTTASAAPGVIQLECGN